MGRALIGLGIFLLTGFGLVGCIGSRTPDAGTLEPVFARPAEIVEMHGLRSGETFGEVLGQASLTSMEQSSLLLAFREQANPRRMRVGTEITIRRREQDGWLRGVDVMLSPDETVRLTRDELGWSSSTVHTPVWTDTIFAAGRIDEILWYAVIDNPQLSVLPVADRARLIHHLDQVFQWQIDFSRQIRQGDYYRFVFERQVRPDGSMRAGHLIAAELVNQGTAYHALWFDPNDDGSGTYYDVEGMSVRRFFLKKPLEFRRISSRFSFNRRHPILGINRPHRAVDYAAATGTPVMATGDGVVIHRGWKGEMGNSVEIQHPNGFLTRYGHFQGFASTIRVGTLVRQGDVIGFVGMTGLANGPHLHYEMWRSGRPIDPTTIQLPAGDPVPDDMWPRWESESGLRLALLEELPTQNGFEESPRTRSADETGEEEGGS